MLFITKEKDIKNWEKKNKYKKIINALLNNNISIRLAAVEVLKYWEPSGYDIYDLRKTAIYYISRTINRNDRNDITELSEMAYTLYRLLDNVEPLLKILDNINNEEIQRTIIIAMGRNFNLSASKEKTRDCLLILQWMKQHLSLSLEMKNLFLFEIGHYYIHSDYKYHDKSILRDALADFGPEAGEQLLLAAKSERELEFYEANYKIHDNVADAEKFAENIIEGKECGSNHNINAFCVCTVCGREFHVLDSSCTCLRCGKKELHIWSSGVYNSHYKCIRCGKLEHMHGYRNEWD